MKKKTFFKDDLYVYGRLLQYTKAHWLAFILAIFGNISYSLIDSGFTYLLKPILDKGFVDRSLVFIKILPFIVVGMFLLRCFANFTANYFMAIVSRSVVMRFRQNIFSHLLKMPASYYDNSSSGQILSIIIYNVDQVSNASADALTTMLESGFLIVGLLTVMFSINWKLSLFYLITVPIIAQIVRFSSKRLRRISSNIQNQMGGVTTIAEETIEGYKVVRAFGGKEYETTKFNKATEKNRNLELKVIATKTLNVSLVQLIAGIAISTTIYLATTTSTLTPGGFAALMGAMLALIKPLKNFTNVNATIQRGLAAAESIFNLLDKKTEKDTGTICIERVKGAIHYNHVSFSYSDTEKEVLSDINFTIEPGQTVALVGRSGGGKTTIINLIQRFYDGIKGTITIDNINLSDFVLSDLRQQFATVSQNVTLFNDTVAHNIAYGRFANANENDIISAAKAANAWSFIQQMSDGIHTLIGENGVLLSGGQRQRIAIARAILKNAPILILDEATSALDTESEQQIQSAIVNLMQNRTTLVIAHRLSTIKKADMILVIDHGKIIESGNHDQLLKLDQHYAKLYKMQFRDT